MTLVGVVFETSFLDQPSSYVVLGCDNREVNIILHYKMIDL